MNNIFFSANWQIGCSFVSLETSEHAISAQLSIVQDYSIVHNVSLCRDRDGRWLLAGGAWTNLDGFLFCGAGRWGFRELKEKMIDPAYG